MITAKDYTIAIPSYGRAGRVDTYMYFGGLAKIFVPESQAKEYASYYRETDLVVIPDNRDGSIAKKRNAIIDYTDTEFVLMVDDDFVKMIDIEKRESLPFEKTIALIEQGFEFLQDSKAHLFGFNYSDDRMRNKPFQPFSMTKPFWQMIGLQKSEIRFDEDLIRGEDVDFWYKHLLRDRLTWRFNNYSVKARDKQKNQQGGIQEKKETEKDLQILVSRWGSKLLKVENGEITGVKSPLTGI